MERLQRRFVSAPFVLASLLEQRFDLLLTVGEQTVHLLVGEILVEGRGNFA